MKRLIPPTILILLLAAMTCFGAEPPNTSATAPSAAIRPGTRRPMPKAEWMDPKHSAPNGTQYRTFTSKVLGREVSYLVWLPPGYEQGRIRYPMIYF